VTRGTAPGRGELPAARLAVLMNAPSVLCLALVLVYPIVMRATFPPRGEPATASHRGVPFTGLANFARLFRDDLFWLSLRHTLVFVAASVAPRS
jgi:multiple sugar transport system permease protein